MGNSGSRGGGGGGSGSSSNTGSYTCKSQGGRSWKDNDGVTNICIRGSSTGNSGNNSSGNYPSGNSNGKGGEGRNGNSSSSDNHHESNRGGSVTQTTFVGKVLSEASKYGLNTVGYQSQVNKMSTDDLSKQYQNWKVLEKQITVGKVLSESDKYGLNNSVYQQQVNTMSDYELSKQYQEWRVLEKRILVGKVLTQYSEATGKSIDEIDETTKSVLNNADQASLEKIYKDNIQNKQVVLAGTILSQLNEISGKPLNELDQETIDFVNNSELATLQLIYNTNVNQKQLLENGRVGLYELYFRLPVNVSYNILYNPGHFNSDMNKLLTRQLDLNNISNLNLSNNQIGDDGAKLLADSFLNGRFPHLKTLRLEGNKITDEGHGFLSKALEVVEQNITVVLKSIQNASKAVAQFAIKEMLHIAKSNGISTKEVLTTQETIEICKKGSWNVGKNIGYGMLKCFTKADKPIAVYEMDFQYLATTLTVNLINPLKKPFQYYCMTESTVFSVVDEDFANCLTGLDSGLNDD